MIVWAAFEAVVNYSTNIHLCLCLCVARQPLCCNHNCFWGTTLFGGRIMFLLISLHFICSVLFCETLLHILNHTPWHHKQHNSYQGCHMALFHCMVRHGTVRYGSLLGGFPLGTVPGTWYFFSTTSVEVPCEPYRYQNVTCKLCWSLIGLGKSSLLRHWTCDTRPSSTVIPARFKSAQPAKDRTQLLFKQTHIFASTTK